jgi:VanZ family protein
LANAKESERRMRSFLKYWLPLISWVALIFIGSTDLMSAEHTGRFLVPFLRWLKPDISALAIQEAHILVRKTGHVTEYAVLGVLLLRAIRHRHFGRRVWIDFGVTLIVALALAAADEFHQSFVPTRTSSPVDVMIDVCGVLIGLAIYWSANRRKWA